MWRFFSRILTAPLYRRACTAALARGDEILPAIREESDAWTMAKDGKRWDGGPGEAPRIAQAKARRKDRTRRMLRVLQEQNAREPRQGP